MSLVRVAASAALLGLLSVACRSTAVSVDDAATRTRPDPADDLRDLRPVTGYKDERKRLALRGLDYSSGRVVPTAEAAELVSGVDPRLAEQEFVRGLELTAHNETLDSVAAHTRAVLLAPGEARMYEGLGLALYTNRMYDRAEAAFRTGLDLEPSSASLHYWMGDVSWRLDERAQALSELEEAVRLDPRHAPAYVRLASVRYYLGDDAGAWRALHAAEDLGASLPGALRGQLARRMPEPPR